MSENEVTQKALRAQEAAVKLATIGAAKKNEALFRMADALNQNEATILEANREDLEHGRQTGLAESLLDRLLLNKQRIAALVQGCRQVASLVDPIGEVTKGWVMPNGLRISQRRVPLGVVGMIYEARPNVTVDAASLCLKAGNAVILRGGKEAIQSNIVLGKIISDAATSVGFPAGTIQVVAGTDRNSVQQLMTANGLIDVLIPRGGAGLIQAVLEQATVPVIETGIGNCHLFIDATGDAEMAVAIALNAKTQRPGVCNAIETLLVHRGHVDRLLPRLLGKLADAGVEIRGCPEACRAFPRAIPALEADWETEFLAMILAVRVVESLEKAIVHIRRYSSRHTEAIVTNDLQNATRFVDEIDASTIVVNASTRFTDGEQFGFGAEVGISTQKLHARGPMGLEALTSTKYIVEGTGQIRP